MLDLSVVIIAHNEERIIGKTLAAVAPIAGEIVLVDSGSTDKTMEIAAKFHALCHHQQWLGYAQQKNFALSLAKKKWILSLDADEIVTPALAKEISAVINSEDSLSGYTIPRLMYIGDKALKYGGFFPDAQLRLFKNGAGKFAERKVHESIKVDGKIGALKSPLLHYAYVDFDHYASTLDKYAKLAAQEKAERLANSKNKNAINLNSIWQTSKVNEIIHPRWTFIYRFVLRSGFLDGSFGLTANQLYADYVRKKIYYLRQSVG